MFSKLILAVNAGSSSLKLALFELITERENIQSTQEPVALLATSAVSNIGSDHPKLSYGLTRSHSDKRNIDLPSSVSDHIGAFEYFLQVFFSDQDLFDSTEYRRDNITHVCHRVVHGGLFTDPVVVEKETYDRLAALSDLAPLHNNRALEIIKSCHTALPKARSVAFFDSAFHRTLPEHIYTYPISPEVAKSKGLRKYGFHGLSYSFILRSVADSLKKPASELNLIVLHLGAGASTCAIRHGESVNTSMGLTPLEGLPGGTRSGSLDPSLTFHYTADALDAGRMSHDKVKSLNITEAERILNMEAGWKALTGTTDFREIVLSDAPSHKLAFDLFVDRVCHYIGGYFVQLEGRLDALVFSGGLGENSPELRNAIMHRCVCLGLDPISDSKNGTKHDTVVFDIGQGTKKIRTLVCRTNEELEIARQCVLKDEFWRSS